MGQVAERITPLTPAQALGALQAVLPDGTSRGGLLMVAAQSAVETASWRSMWNWNFGNVTPTAAQLQTHDWVMHAQTGSMKYLAFSDPISGAKVMVDWLTSHGLLAAAEAGDLDAYMAGLQNGSYLGTVGLVDGNDYTNYKNAIAGLMAQYASVQPVAPPGWGSLADWGKVLGFVALPLVGFIYRASWLPAVRRYFGL